MCSVLWWSCNEIIWCILCVILAIYGTVNIKIYSNGERGGDGLVMTNNSDKCVKIVHLR